MLLKCTTCGLFSRIDPGSSSADIYDITGMGGLDRTIFRCADCTTRVGPVTSNARPHDGDMSKYQTVYR